MPEVLTHTDANSDITLYRRSAKGGSRCANRIASREEASLIKESIRWEVALARHVSHLSPLEERCGGEETMVIGRFHKGDHRGGAAARELRERLEAWVGSPHRHLWREILQLVSGEAELGEDHEVGTRRATLSDLRLMEREVLREVTKHWGDLREGEHSASHQTLLFQVPRVDGPRVERALHVGLTSLPGEAVPQQDV